MAAIVGENDGTDDEVIAALLQDAPEDAGGEAQLTEIRARFGDGVADIVAGCTDTYEDSKPPWRTRKEDYLDHLAKAPSPVRRVSASPRRTRSSTTPAPCCRTTVLSDCRAVGEDLWGRFNGGRSGKLWYYRAVAGRAR